MQTIGGKQKELTVCDIIGDFGLYQWSLTLFAIIYSSLISLTVVVGPIWTPDLAHLCSTQDNDNNNTNVSSLIQSGADFSSQPHQCFADDGKACTLFIYDDANYGKILTNSFDLVCDRQWLRSFISSSALTGMLISSVTLGLLSDRYGRKRMIWVGFVISILATITALLAHNYFLLNISYMLMSYAQVGIANALCVLVMEATPPRLRFVAIFEYGIGWGLGQALVPLINDLTRDYRLFLGVMLAVQFALLPWLHWGITESIRWLISEGDINRAQIELRRACRWNGKPSGAELAQRIAQVQVQQLRKASLLIGANLQQQQQPADLAAAAAEAAAAEQTGGQIRDELLAINHALRRTSFALNGGAQPPPPPLPELATQTTDFILDGDDATDSTGGGGARLPPPPLSPTLARKSVSLFSAPIPLTSEGETSAASASGGQRNSSISTQTLVRLALKHSKAIQREDEGGCFLVQMFHRKLYKMTLVLMLVSVMLETSYYGLIQANGFVGSSVSLNYYSGALIEWLSAFLFIAVLWAFNRRTALILPTLLASAACLGIALSYHLIPGGGGGGGGGSADIDSSGSRSPPLMVDVDAANITGLMDQPGSLIVNETLQLGNSNQEQQQQQQDQLRLASGDSKLELLEFREQLNFWLLFAGKLSISVAIQIAYTIAMEAYPNNLRQSGSGAMVFVGRVGSILVPFLINDSSPQRTTFKLTLAGLAALGVLVSLIVPCFLPNNKDQELCDRLNEIPDQNSTAAESPASQRAATIVNQ